MNAINFEDIEEGEIVENDEDLDIEYIGTFESKKSLPRRYDLQENLRNKHKKSCRHRKAKKTSSIKKSVQFDCKEKEFCSKNGHIKRTVRRISPVRISPTRLNSKKSALNSNSLFSEIKESLKHFKKSPKTTNRSALASIPKNFSLSETISFPKPLPDLKAKKELKSFGEENNSNYNDSDIQKNNSVINSDLNIIHNIKKKSQERASNSAVATSSIAVTRCEKNESEDEDELRRQALATCANKTSIEKRVIELADKGLFPSFQDNLFNNKVADNYEVIDMEIDDNQSSGENIDDDLFIIDTNPFLPDVPNQIINEVDSKDQPTLSQLDDEFEEQLLRAELLANLNSKTSSICNNSKELESNVTRQNSCAKPQLKSMQVKLHPVAKPLKNCAKKSLKNNSRTVFRNPPKRIVISLGNESSTEEESDVETEVNGKKVENNYINSLDALISDARKKSDQEKIHSENAIVSCLSEAQQKEYNYYMKLLNGNKGGQTVEKNNTAHSVEDELSLKEKNLFVAQKNYLKDKKLISNELKEVLRKKSLYFKSKLNAELISKQLIAAEKVKKSNLLIYQKAVAHLRTLKKNLIMRKNNINNIEESCTKLGVSLKGNNYVLPSFMSEVQPLQNK